jgi:4-diphosphocytidyl-2-C-methyl-D-erythritol kinase
MVVFPNCKINLGLKILRKRADGYHDLSTVFYPLPVKDALEIIHTPNSAFSSYGLPIPGTGNLCENAYQLLKNDFPTLPNVHIHLYKNIPIGAGLGGGSADGAFTLLALNKQFHLNLDTTHLVHYAAQLGSDCPFFILNKPCLGSGRGEQLEPMPLDLSAYSFALIDPGVHINTAQAFSLCNPGEEKIPLKDIISQPIRTWKEHLHNDFETPLFHLHPQLRTVKDTLYTHGALYASLTGSGSSFYGIFEKHQAPTTLPLSYNYRILP